MSCASQILDKGLGVIFQEGEVAYFTLFFAASLERSHKVAHRRVSAIVVCREGISTSQILKAKLYAEFDLNVVGVYSVREARSWLLQNHENEGYPGYQTRGEQLSILPALLGGIEILDKGMVVSEGVVLDACRDDEGESCGYADKQRDYGEGARIRPRRHGGQGA